MAALRSKSRSFLEAIPRCFCGGNYLLSTPRYRLYSNYQTQEKSTHFGFEEVSEQEKTQKGRQDQRFCFFFASQMCKFPSFRCQINHHPHPPLGAAWTVSLYLSVIPYFWLIMWINMIFLRIKHVCLILQKCYEAVTVTYINTYLGLVCKTWQLHA